MLFLLQLITIMSCSLFSGAALYINMVEHPARMACGTKLASTVFGPSYRRAAVMQVSLALIATIFAILSWSMTKTEYWLIGALWIFSVIPFTLLMIAPTNRKLLNHNLDLRTTNTHKLLVHWGQLHAVRTVASLIATIFVLFAAFRS